MVHAHFCQAFLYGLRRTSPSLLDAAMRNTAPQSNPADGCGETFL
jgi:hypothetical protein